MPYTPPAQQSPVASTTGSPTLSRTHSHSRSLSQNTSHGSRPGLPRSSSSTSYLHRHRRSPSLPAATQVYNGVYSTPESPEETPIEGHFSETPTRVGGESVRQSPPPMNNDSSMPIGAVMSPPDSGQNSSDEEDQDKRGRSRSLENLAELQAAIRVIEQHREGSPDKVLQELKKAKMSLGLKVPNQDSSDSTDESSNSVSQPASDSKKSLHSSSASDSAILDMVSSKTESPNGSSDSEIDDERMSKPPMLRKKSGELVRPALRPASSRRRPSSMPGTPTYSKAVKFDQQLEHVRHFLQVDRPAAVSANSSPVETYEGESEFPFGAGNKSREAPWQWEIKLPNFPRDSLHRKRQPIHVERVFLSGDCKTLVGTVAVQNLAFQKVVVARFTLDHWKTTSEVVAEYSNDTRRPQDGLDRFNFNVKIEDLPNCENRTLFFCVRYIVNGQEFWDSNGDVNFQVNFAKKAMPQHGKQGMQSNATKPLNSLPRSRPSPPTSSGRPRPKSASSFDDFAHGLESFEPPFASFNDTPLRFRNKNISTGSEPNPPMLKKKAPAQAFGNRYDFGASLSAAIQSATTALGEKSGIQLKAPSVAAGDDPKQEFANGGNAQPTPNAQGPVASNEPKPAALVQGKPDVKSQSYNELLDKYCFFGSAKTTSQQNKPAVDEPAGSDTTSEGSSSNASSIRSSPSSSPPVEEAPAAPALPTSPPTSPHIRLSNSPGMNFSSRTVSPAFGYPYHQSHGIFPDAHTPTAIRG